MARRSNEFEDAKKNMTKGANEFSLFCHHCNTRNQRHHTTSNLLPFNLNFLCENFSSLRMIL